MFNQNEILKSAFYYIFFILVSLVFGFILERIAQHKKDSNELSLFWKLFIGTMLMISVYAIFVTKGVTIFLISPFLLYFFVRQKMSVPAKTICTSHQQIVFFVCSIILNYLFYLWALSSFNSDNIVFVSGDFNIYFRIAQQFNQFGIENASLDSIYRPLFAAPYHYGDVWMYAIVSRFVSTNPSIVYLVAFGHFSVIFINGIYTYIQNLFAPYLKNKQPYLYFLLLAGLFTGFNLFFPKFILPSAEPYTLSVMNWSKVLVPSCVLMGLLIEANSKSWKTLIILAMIGGLSFINALPAIFMSVFLLLTFNLITRSISFKKWFQFNLFYVLITVVFILFLYKVLPSVLNVPIVHKSDGISVLKTMNIQKYLKTAINIFIGGWFQLFVLTPYFIILIIGLYLTGKLKDFKQLLGYINNSLLLLFFIVFSGLTCWALLHNFDVNSVQFFSNVLSPFSVTVVSIILIFILLKVNNTLIKTISVLTVFVCIYSHRTDQFFTTSSNSNDWTKLNSYLKDKGENSVFVNLKPMNTYNAFFEKYTTIFIPLTILSYKWPNYQNISLNAPFIPINPKSVFLAEETSVVNSAPFMVYYKGKLNEGIKDIGEISLQFVKDYNVGYVSIAKDTILPVYFRNLVKDSLLLENDNFTVYRIK